MIDVHSHLVFGVDDGSKTIEESVEIIKGLYEMGVTDTIITPHYINETIYISPKLENLKKIDKIKEELLKQNINVNLYLGNEVYIDKDISKCVKENKICTLNNTEYILIELPMSGIYPDYLDIFLGLINEGFKVVLAHPERYTAFQKDFNKIYELSEIGVLFQCNLGSILGEYGKEATKVIKRLLKEKLVYMIGTDIHHPKKKYDMLKKATKKYKKYLNDEEIEDILKNNAKKILN